MEEFGVGYRECGVILMKCMFCGSKVEPGSKYCYSCGAEVGEGGEDIIFAPSDLTGEGSGQAAPVSSGASLLSAVQAGKEHTLPSGNKKEDLNEIRGWNWGAFFFTWIWALGNGLPVVGIVSAAVCILFSGIGGLIVAIYLGANGNELLWSKRKFSSVESFKKIQKGWSIAALIVMFFIIGIFFLAVLMEIMR